MRRHRCAFRAGGFATAHKIYAREYAAQRNVISFRRSRYVIAVCVYDRDFHHVVIYVLVDDVDYVYEFRIFRKAIVISQTDLVDHYGGIGFYEAIHFFANRRAAGRFIDRDRFRTRGIVIFDVDLLAKVGGITGTDTQFKIYVRCQTEILMHLDPVDTHAIDRPASTVPYVLDTGHKVSFLTSYGIIGFTVQISCLRRAIDRDDLASRPIKCRTDYYDTVGRAPERGIVIAGINGLNFRNDTRQIIFVTKNAHLVCLLPK